MRKRKDFSVVKSTVYNALRVGQENAMGRSDLCRATGYNDRLVREAIEALRHEKAILNLDGGKGYYLPLSSAAGRREAGAWLLKQERRIRSMRAATKGARRFVYGEKSKDIPGQLSLFKVGGL